MNQFLVMELLFQKKGTNQSDDADQRTIYRKRLGLQFPDSRSHLIQLASIAEIKVKFQI